MSVQQQGGATMWYEGMVGVLECDGIRKLSLDAVVFWLGGGSFHTPRLDRHAWYENWRVSQDGRC